MNKFAKIIISALTVCLTASVTSSSPAGAGQKETWDDLIRDEVVVGLLYEVTVKINSDYTFLRQTHIINRIQKESGKNIGEISIYYDKNREEIRDIEAYTILPDGSRKKAEKIQDMDSPNSYGVYTDQKRKVISMPNVVAGSTIEQKTTTISREPIISNNFYDSFRFDSGHPIKEARYRVVAPAEMKLDFRKINTDIEPKIETAGDKIIYAWEMSEIEKVDPEEYMPGTIELHKRITVSTLRDWKHVSAWLLSLFSKNMKVSPDISAKVTELTSGKKTEREKIQAILEYIQKDFRYVSMNIEMHGYEPHPAELIFSNKYGDCKDQTLLAIVMLSQIGVKAWPVLYSTWAEPTRDDLLPMPLFFDHIILLIEHGSKKYYTDILQNGYYFYEIPAAIAGKRVFVVDDRGGFFDSIPEADADESTSDINQKVLIRADGTALIEMDALLPRGASINMREALKNAGSEEKIKTLAYVETQLIAGGRMIDKKWINLDVPHSRIRLKLTYEHPALVQKMGDMMMFGLPQLSRLAIFSAPTRKYPIVFSYVTVKNYNVVYTIPENYRILSLPGKAVLSSSIGCYVREYTAQKRSIKAKEISTLKYARIPASEYEKLQAYLDSIPKATNEKIVIKKRAGSGR